MTRKRSTLPWKVAPGTLCVSDAFGFTVARVYADMGASDEDLPFIVNACNAHDEFVQLAQAIIDHRHNPGAVAPYLASLAHSALKKAGV